MNFCNIFEENHTNHTISLNFRRTFDNKAFEAEFGSNATYPQVAIGYHHIGSMKEALQYMNEQGMFV